MVQDGKRRRIVLLAVVMLVAACGTTDATRPAQNEPETQSPPEKVRPPPEEPGICSKEDIARRIRAVAPHIRDCFVDRLQGNPELAGEVTLHFRIGRGGTVAFVEVIDKTLNDRPTCHCIEKVVAPLTFEKPRGGTCTIKWPFIFNSE